MRILLVGATGGIGSRILAEAASRGHDVTAVARDLKGLADREHVKAVAADAKDVARLSQLAAGQVAVVSTTSLEGGSST